MNILNITDRDGNQIDHLTQYDKDITLYIRGLNLTDAPECQFFNSSSISAQRVQSTISDGVISVIIPNNLLTQSLLIKMYVYVYDTVDNSAKTKYVANIPVRAKLKPDDYIYEENQDEIDIYAMRNNIQTLINYMNNDIAYHTVTQGLATVNSDYITDGNCAYWKCGNVVTFRLAATINLTGITAVDGDVIICSGLPVTPVQNIAFPMQIIRDTSYVLPEYICILQNGNIILNTAIGNKDTKGIFYGYIAGSYVCS